MLTGVRPRFGCAPEAAKKAFTTEVAGDTEDGTKWKSQRGVSFRLKTSFPFWLYHSSLSSVTSVSSVVKNLAP
jgi:hypothetical protein